jgi:hypothetical protein
MLEKLESSSGPLVVSSKPAKKSAIGLRALFWDLVDFSALHQARTIKLAKCDQLCGSEFRHGSRSATLGVHEPHFHSPRQIFKVALSPSSPASDSELPGRNFLNFESLTRLSALS